MSLLIETLEMTLVSSSICWPMEVTFDLDLQERKMQWAWIDFNGNNIHPRDLGKCVGGRSNRSTQFSPSSNVCSSYTISSFTLKIRTKVQFLCKLNVNIYYLSTFLNELHFVVWSQRGIEIFTSIDVTGPLIFNPQIKNDFTLLTECTDQTIQTLYECIKVASKISQGITREVGKQM